MSEKTEKLLENIKSYCGISLLFLIVGDAIFSASMYDDYGSLFTYNKALNGVAITLFVLTVILTIVYAILCIVMRKQQGAAYVSLKDLLETIIEFLFPVYMMDRGDISWMLAKLGETKEIKKTDLWRAMTKGIHILNLLAFIFLFTLGSGIVYVVIQEWIHQKDKLILSTVLGTLYVVILYFWGLVCAFGIKKRPDDVLTYISENELSYMDVNRDFVRSKSYGRRIHKGEQYLFVSVSKSMQMVAIKDITECKVIRMGGGRAPYYVLQIITEKEVIMKYGIIPYYFYKLKYSLM